MKKCARCKKTLSLSSFYKRDSKYYDSYCKKCKQEKYGTKRKQYHKDYYVQNAQKRFERHLKYTYNITLEDHEHILKKQNERCAICKTKFKNSRDTHVDHNHETGRVRGILCSQCNLMLGIVEKTEFVTKAQLYLRGLTNDL